MSTFEEHQSKYDKLVEEAEKERLSRPLVDRLRDCGPFRASDGIMSVKLGDYKDSHDAADEIERLVSEVSRLRHIITNAIEAVADLDDTPESVRVFTILSKGQKD